MLVLLSLDESCVNIYSITALSLDLAQKLGHERVKVKEELLSVSEGLLNALALFNLQLLHPLLVLDQFVHGLASFISLLRLLLENLLFLEELSEAHFSHSLIHFLLLSPNHLLVLQLSELLIHRCQVRVESSNHVVIFENILLCQFGGVLDVHRIL